MIVTSCNSTPVKADPSTHSITYYVEAPIGCGFRIRDTDNGILVLDETVEFTPEVGAINGLTDSYRVELHRCVPTRYASILGWK